MNSIVFKRIMAFFIDLLIISLLSGLLSNIKLLNPWADKYETASQKYVDYANEMLSSPDNMSYDNLFSDELIDYHHDLSKYGLCYVIIEAVVSILYFSLFPFFNKNKTIGKDLFHIEVKDASFGKLLFKSILVPISSSYLLYNSLGSIVLASSVFIFSKKVYFYFYIIFSLIMSLFCYLDVIFMLVRSDHKSLHDLITNTYVDNI